MFELSHSPLTPLKSYFQGGMCLLTTLVSDGHSKELILIVFVLIHAERSRQMQQHMLQDEAGGGGADPVSSLVSSTS